MSGIGRLKRWARRMKTDALTLRYASIDPRTPWYVRALAISLVIYAFSPIDLIPDFIPVLGYVDDLILLPLGIYLLIRLLPGQVVEDSRRRAREHLAGGWAKPRSRAGLFVVATAWMLALFATIWLIQSHTK